MNKELVKKAMAEAEKEAEEKQIAKVKDIVKATLNKIQDTDKKIDELKEEIKKLEEEKKLLKLDIDDLKEGRLDRIEERQTADVKARRISVIIVKKEVHHHHDNWWYQPYQIEYIPYPPSTNAPLPYNPIYCTTTNNAVPLSSDGVNKWDSNQPAVFDAVFTLNGSTAKNFAVGTYSVGNKIVHLR